MTIQVNSVVTMRRPPGRRMLDVGRRAFRRIAERRIPLRAGRAHHVMRTTIFAALSGFLPACLLLLPCPALATDDALPSLDLDTFRPIPVMSNGRAMPMDSYARNLLLQFSGRRSFAGEPAAAWLAGVLFSPETARTQQVFLVNHPGVVQALGVEPEKRRRYSFDQLDPGLEKLHELAGKAGQLDQKDRSPVENELVRLYANVSQYATLTRAFSFSLPSPDFTIENAALKARLALPDHREAFSFIDIMRNASGLQELVVGLGDKPSDQWTAEEQEAFRLSSALFAWSRAHRGIDLGILPAQAHGDEVWLSPWDALGIGIRDETTAQALDALTDMAVAYRAGAQVEFDLATRSFASVSQGRAAHPAALRKVGLEVTFNRLRLFGRATVLYILAFLTSLVFFATERKTVFRIGMVLLFLALIPHTAGMIMRMVIMGRPPVTNLYATFIFVAWVCVLLGLLLERMQRNGLGLLVASFGGLSLLMVAGRFFSDGDTMGQVVAVLDSNFWLTTHVLTITIGYAGCLFAGVLGHVYLLTAVFAPRREELLAATYRAVFGTLAFGLLFSFLGTMLGGVWADQSWGRFWGWDPKENGALLIVLWTAILLHAKPAGWIGRRGMAAGAVLGVNVVLTAWLGVNLLSVGLHSYGFTSGLAAAFFGAIAFEIAFVAVTVPLARRAG